MAAALCPGKAREGNKEYDQYLTSALAAPCGWSVAEFARTKKEKEEKVREKESQGKEQEKESEGA